MKTIEIMQWKIRIKNAKEDLKRVEARYVETKDATDGCYIYSLQSYIIDCCRIIGKLKGWSFEKTHLFRVMIGQNQGSMFIRTEIHL